MRVSFGVIFSLCFVLGFGQSGQDTTTLVERLDNIQISSLRIYENGVATLSRKQFLTMAGALEDPTRLLIKTPGISTANDQANSVIYHGMPAQYHQWSLYGARILNPNHNSNAGTISDLPSTSAGGVNMLSGQVIGALEFNGNPSSKSLGSVAGMSDVKLRNPYKTGITTNLSLIGMEAGYDRVFGIGNLMVNYRYSTVGILTSGLGLDFGGERINYQDLTSKYSIKKKSGEYSFYFSAGTNSTRKDALDTLITEFKDLQESDYTAKILVGGINHRYKNKKYEINNTINVSRRVVDKLAEADIPITSTIQYKNRGTLLSLNHNYTRKYKNWELGYRVESWLEDQFLMKLFPTEFNGLSIERKIDKTSLSVQPTMNIGVNLLHNLSFSSTVGYSSQHSGENIFNLIGHVGLEYRIKDLQIDLTFSRATQNQAIELALDSFSLENQVSDNLQLSLGYKGFGILLYHHKLNDLATRDGLFGVLSLRNFDNLPITYSNQSIFDASEASISGMSIFMNRKILGIDINANITLQNSSALYGGNISTSERDIIPYDYRHILNISLQKEWQLKSSKKIGVSGSFHHRGGERQFVVSTSDSFDWGYTEFDYGIGGPVLQLADYFRADLRIYYKPSKRSTISLDIQNVTNRENDAYYYYEPLTGESTLKKQLGMIPILSWRVDW